MNQRILSTSLMLHSILSITQSLARQSSSPGTCRIPNICSYSPIHLEGNPSSLSLPAATLRWYVIVKLAQISLGKASLSLSGLLWYFSAPLLGCLPQCIRANFFPSPPSLQHRQLLHSRGLCLVWKLSTQNLANGWHLANKC